MYVDKGRLRCERPGGSLGMDSVYVCLSRWFQRNSESGRTQSPKGLILTNQLCELGSRWIVDNSELPRIRLHDLRHTHASIAVKAGVPIGVVSERLGHASPEFTLHRYAHVMPGMQREAADKIARAVKFDGLAASTRRH